MKAHPFADRFPMLSEAELLDLGRDIRDHGQKVPIILWRDHSLIVDGRNRARACELAGVNPWWEEHDFKDDGEVARYIISANLHRRHLSESQRALLGAELEGLYSEAARERMAAGGRDKGLANLPTLHAREEAARDVNVSPRLVQSAKKVLLEGAPELVEAVRGDQISASAAAELAKLPAEEQRATLAAGPEAIREKVRELRSPAARPIEPLVAYGRIAYEDTPPREERRTPTFLPDPPSAPVPGPAPALADPIREDAPPAPASSALEVTPVVLVVASKPPFEEEGLLCPGCMEKPCACKACWICQSEDNGPLVWDRELLTCRACTPGVFEEEPAPVPLPFEEAPAGEARSPVAATVDALFARVEGAGIDPLVASAEQLGAEEPEARTREAYLLAQDDDWNTPPEVLEVVRSLGTIALDPCSNPRSMVGARTSWEEKDDGLSRGWVERSAGELVFVNPPFGKAINAWAKKIREEARRGAEIVLLVPARVDQPWFQDDLWQTAQAFCLWRGRIRFWREGKPGKATSTFPTLFAYWGPNASFFAEAFSPFGRVFSPDLDAVASAAE